MEQKKKRNLFATRNKYQLSIILLTFFPPVVVCTSMAIFITIMYYQMLNVIRYNSSAVVARSLTQWSGLIVGVLCAMCIVSLFWVFILSSRLVGPFERIIRELDEVIEHKKKKKIVARTKDELANQILKRINVLIDQLHS
jgi:hypothetical protein